jgi:hypothetical protein
MLSNCTSELDATEKASLYKQFCEEAQEAGFQAWFDAYQNNVSATFQFEMGYLKNGKSYCLILPVYADIMPKTTAQYDALIQTKQQDELDKITYALHRIKEQQLLIDGNMTVTYCESGDSSASLWETFYSNPSWSLSESLDTPLAILDAVADNTTITSDPSYIDITLSIWEVESENYDEILGSYSFRLPVDKATYQTILQAK